MLEILGNGKPLISDGAMGSLLIEKGLEAGNAPESMNFERPEVLEEIAAAYLAAGADILHTNTFGGSGLKLSSYALDGKVKEINEIAVAAARKVAGGDAVVSASCGPTGKLLKPFGDVEEDALYDTFRRQLEFAIGAGVDAVTVETMTDLTEATLAVKAAKSISRSIPVLATMTFDSTPRGFFTIMGVSIEQAARGLEEAGADVIGSNCGNGIETMVEIAREFTKVSKVPILIQANAGLPEIRDDVVIYPESPEFMAEKSKALVDLGVAIIGGCCGTTPEHIRALRRMVDGGN
jgi:5-methyltetrahydrofolate--homocysteine methyltransferase